MNSLLKFSARIAQSCLLVGLISPAAHAAECADAVGGQPTTADFVFNGSPADSCKLLDGNDSAEQVNIDFPLMDDSWVQLVRFNEAAEPEEDDFPDVGDFFTNQATLNGIEYTFKVTYDGVSSGFYLYSLDVTPVGDLPFLLDIIGVIKQGSGYAGFLFEDELLGTNNDGKFRVLFGPGDNAFSHFTFYGANVQVCDEEEEDCGTDDEDVPEPGSLALLGLGLSLAAIVRRRKTVS